MQQNDFITELGYLSFSTKLKRISDTLIHDGRRLYSQLDVDIEPNWFVIFKLLQSKGKLSVTEISEAVMMSHPTIITLTNKMISKGYLISEKDPKDSRKRVLDLSSRAIKKLPEYELIWNAGCVGMEKALEGMDALVFIDKLEKVFIEKGFKNRTLDALEDNLKGTISIISFDEKYTKDFTRLNYEWLEKYFYIEEYDKEVLTKPKKYILDPGGYIFFALLDGIPVGTVALIKREEGVFELSKMGVTEKNQGQKIGQKLMDHCIKFTKKNGITRLFLDSSRKLKPAITLYKKVGFKEIPVPEDTPYERCDIRMEIPIK